MATVKNRYKYPPQYKRNPLKGQKVGEAVDFSNEDLDNGQVIDNVDQSFQSGDNDINNLENINENLAVLESVKNIQLKAELEDWKNRALRMAADIQNLQNQTQQDQNIVRKNTKKNLINSLVPFLNTLNLAFSYMPATDDIKVQKFVNALQGSFNSLTPELVKHGVEVILPVIGDAFDPISMTALNQSADANLAVKQVVGIGIRIDGQLTTPATVMV